MKLESLPTKYVPFSEINICSNRFVNGKVLFVVNEHIPILIGYGKAPRIWVNIPADLTGENWQPLVRDNRSLHAKVEVKVSGNVVEVITPTGNVLRVMKENKNLAKVGSIDLRPFGIDIYGNEEMLTVLENYFSENLFTNVSTMIKIGGSS